MKILNILEYILITRAKKTTITIIISGIVMIVAIILLNNIPLFNNNITYQIIYVIISFSIGYLGFMQILLYSFIIIWYILLKLYYMTFFY